MIFQLKKELRKELRKPFGKVVRGEEGLKKELWKMKWTKLICVGDFSSLITRRIGLTPDVSIIDGYIERRKTDENTQYEIQAPIELQANNPPGFITKEAWEMVKLSFCYTKPVKLSIEGEEDLLFLAAVFFAPINSAIVYGIRRKGGVVAKADKKLKDQVKKLLGWQPLEKIVAGGTFDRLHAGHKFLLLTALEYGEKILIGVTSSKYLKKFKKDEKDISSFHIRSKTLKKFLAEFNFSYCLYKIDDFLGPACNIGQAIIVSENTYKNACKINKVRKKQSLQPLEIIKIKDVLAKDDMAISSSRIRKKEININGFILG